MAGSLLTAAPPQVDRPAAARRIPSGRRAPLLALTAGLLAAAAFPPLGWSFTAPLAVAALALSVSCARPRAGALLGLLFGAAFFLPLLHWSATFVGALPWLLLAASQAAFCAALGAGLAVASRVPGWPLWMACLWVAADAARARVPFGGFPWGRLGFSQPAGPFLPYARLGGVPLVTFAVALTGTLLAAAVLRRPPRRLLALGAAVLVPAVGLVVTVTGRSANSAAAGPAATVALVQGNVPPEGLTGAAEDRAVLRRHVAETERLAAAVRAGRLPRPDLVLWPENASDLDPYRDAQAYRLIDRAVRAVGVPVVVGAVLDAGRHVRNSGIVWSPTTGPGQVYDKRHPVPFAEYIPLRPLARLVSAKVDLVPRDFLAGHRPGVLQVGPARVGDLICFEVAEDGLARDVVRGGGQVLLVQTNNSTFGRSAETEQQLAMSRVRAVEHDRAVLVAATSGISAVIGPTGRVEQRTGLFTPATLLARVPLRSSRTPADRAAAWPEAVLAAAGLLALLGAGGNRGRPRVVRLR